MGANDAREQLAVAIEEYNKLEAKIEKIRSLANEYWYDDDARELQMRLESILED